ncbi:unnamed protein product, partial [Amoebophrya sp. A120]
KRVAATYPKCGDISPFMALRLLNTIVGNMCAERTKPGKLDAVESLPLSNWKDLRRKNYLRDLCTSVQDALKKEKEKLQKYPYYEQKMLHVIENLESPQHGTAAALQRVRNLLDLDQRLILQTSDGKIVDLFEMFKDRHPAAVQNMLRLMVKISTTLVRSVGSGSVGSSSASSGAGANQEDSIQDEPDGNEFTAAEDASTTALATTGAAKNVSTGITQQQQHFCTKREMQDQVLCASVFGLVGAMDLQTVVEFERSQQLQIVQQVPAAAGNATALAAQKDAAASTTLAANQAADVPGMQHQPSAQSLANLKASRSIHALEIIPNGANFDQHILKREVNILWSQSLSEDPRCIAFTETNRKMNDNQVKKMVTHSIKNRLSKEQLGHRGGLPFVSNNVLLQQEMAQSNQYPKRIWVLEEQYRIFTQHCEKQICIVILRDFIAPNLAKDKVYHYAAQQILKVLRDVTNAAHVDEQRVEREQKLQASAGGRGNGRNNTATGNKYFKNLPPSDLKKRVMGNFSEDVKKQLLPFLTSSYQLRGRGTEVPPGEDVIAGLHDFQGPMDVIDEEEIVGASKASKRTGSKAAGNGDNPSSASASSSANNKTPKFGNDKSKKQSPFDNKPLETPGTTNSNAFSKDEIAKYTSSKCTNFRQLVGWMIIQVNILAKEKNETLFNNAAITYHSAQIFIGCYPVIKTHNLALARYLAPFLLRIILVQKAKATPSLSNYASTASGGISGAAGGIINPLTGMGNVPGAFGDVSGGNILTSSRSKVNNKLKPANTTTSDNLQSEASGQSFLKSATSALQDLR